jgi:putative phosphoribosyl transferase
MSPIRDWIPGLQQRFHDRADAGRQLAQALSAYAGQPDVHVLGLPRGGVPVAFEVAQALHAPLDVFLVRKLGVPGHEELAFGAIASGGVRVLNQDVVQSMRLGEATIDRIAAREEQELLRRSGAYRGERPPLDVADRAVIVVDDGLATGATMRAAVKALRQMGPARIVVAVPVGAPETCAMLDAEADELVCPLRPAAFYAVGAWYENFGQTSDEEVQTLLRRAATSASPPRPAPQRPPPSRPSPG